MPYTRELVQPLRVAFRRWEVRAEEGSPVIGWLQEHRIGRSSTLFIEATATDPFGDVVDLESSPDWDDRLQAVLRFHEYPERELGRHWRPLQSRLGAYLAWLDRAR